MSAPARCQRMRRQSKPGCKLSIHFIIILAVVMMFSSMVHAAVAYKWVDDSGRVYISDVPPADGNYEVVQQRHLKKPSGEAHQRMQNMIESQKASRDARLADKEERKNKLAEKKRLKENCSRSRERLIFLQDRPARRILTKDSTGERRRITESERQERLDKVKKQIKENCKK